MEASNTGGLYLISRFSVKTITERPRPRVSLMCHSRVKLYPVISTWTLCLRRPPRARSGNRGRLAVANTVSSYVKKSLEKLSPQNIFVRRSGRHQGYHKCYIPVKTYPRVKNYPTLKFMLPTAAAVTDVP